MMVSEKVREEIIMGMDGGLENYEGYLTVCPNELEHGSFQTDVYLREETNSISAHVPT